MLKHLFLSTLAKLADGFGSTDDPTHNGCGIHPKRLVPPLLFTKEFSAVSKHLAINKGVLYICLYTLYYKNPFLYIKNKALFIIFEITR